MKKLLLSTAAIAVMTLSAGAEAAEQTGTANAVVATPISIGTISNMEFGKFAIDSDANINATVSTISGDNDKVQQLGTAAAATVTVSGEATASYTLLMKDVYAGNAVNQVTLGNGTSTMPAALKIVGSTPDAGTGGYAFTLAAGGSDALTIDGTISGLSANQDSSALYTGTYTVTVTYP